MTTTRQPRDLARQSLLAGLAGVLLMLAVFAWTIIGHTVSDDFSAPTVAAVVVLAAALLGGIAVVLAVVFRLRSTSYRTTGKRAAWGFILGSATLLLFAAVLSVPTT